MNRWIGKSAVVTGASSGIGEAIAKSLTIAGMNVFGLARRENRLDELSKSLREAKGYDFYFSILGLQTSYFYRDINLYSPSKHALHAMNATLRDEVTGKKENIRVTGIYPGMVKTEIVKHSGHGSEVYNILPYIKSEQIADCVLFALSAPPGTQVNQIVITPLHQKM
ncbi:hypothetical protein PV327_008379 [Microctonus hyperodae]|uniref:Uncharacterized protein n=1 Tax=Microctonus hyperodae TaxID=165561 RepID=A0AA39KH29_MICHY|nr:hypothetical protein PV327_008379 [Microctonus hyperodae]